ncbi:hypothetical protein M153_290260001, partial [Pseudoloma neurophilia]
KFELFKDMLVDFVCDDGIDTYHKFRDESWESYLKRLKLLREVKGLSDKDIIKHLRTTIASIGLQTLFLTPGITLSNLNEMIKDCEFVQAKNKKLKTKQKFGNKPKKNSYNKKNVTCYMCNESGHISTSCPNKSSAKKKKVV